MKNQNAPSLYDISEEIREILYGLEDEDFELEEKLNELQYEFEDKADRIAWLVDQKKGDIETLDKEIKRLQARKKTAERRVDNLKRYLMMNMELSGLKRLKTPTHSFSIRNTKRVVVDDEEQFMKDHPEFTDVKTTYRLKKKEIMDNFRQNGEIFDGSRIEENQSLTIR